MENKERLYKAEEFILYFLDAFSTCNDNSLWNHYSKQLKEIYNYDFLPGHDNYKDIIKRLMILYQSESPKKRRGLLRQNAPPRECRKHKL